MIPVAIGYDPREAAVFHALVDSIFEHTTVPVSIIPLHKKLLGKEDWQRDGTNAFTYSRFLVPALTGFTGWAIYMDSDMLLRADLMSLWGYRDPTKAALCVKHEYSTSTGMKFIGTPIEAQNIDYPRKNWSSLILWNCEHPRNRILTEDFVSESAGGVLHRFAWLRDEEIGEIPPAWNHLVGEYPYDAEARNVHFTLGAPGFGYYADSDYANEWHKHLVAANRMIGEKASAMLKRSENV